MSTPPRHVAVVTGASQGIGEAIARRLAQIDGMRLMLVARNSERLKHVASDCAAHGAETAVSVCDVTDRAAVDRMAAETGTRFGAPTLLVNNAGAFVPGTLADTRPDDVASQLSVNLVSAFHVTQAFAPAMKEGGLIVFMGSVASVRGYPGGLAYTAAKHGLLGLARGVREELKPKGIRVTTLLPGATLTPSWDGVDLPASRFIPAEDVAAIVECAYLLSPRTVLEEILIRPQLGDL